MKGLLLSGGLDSTAIAHLYRPELAFNINYGQRPAQAERTASSRVAERLGIELVNIDIDCSSIGSGDLTNSDMLSIGNASDWWPFRNQLLITLAATKAVSMGCEELMIGTISEDQYHADGSPEFISKICQLIESQEGNLKITAPAISMTGVSLISKSGLTHEQLALTHSCHKSNVACGKCRGCNKFQSTMEELGYYDFE